MESITLPSSPFSLDHLRLLWPDPGGLPAVLLFGSRAKNTTLASGDWDIGLVTGSDTGSAVEISWPANWDIFIWDAAYWRRGFALQLELARTAEILHDPLNIVRDRFEFLRAEVLPRWGGYLREDRFPFASPGAGGA